MADAHRTPVSFVGTVLEVDDDRVSVRVDDVLRAPGVLGDLTGTTVAVLTSTAELSIDRQYRFDVEGASYGTELVFRAIAVASGEDRSTPAGDPQLAGLARSADLIVVGAVESVGTAVAGERLTEHDPAPATARVRVLSTVKGSAEGVLDVAVPTSADVQWQQTMSPGAGSTAVFFLGRRGTAYEAVDVHPVETLEQVRSVVAGL